MRNVLHFLLLSTGMAMAFAVMWLSNIPDETRQVQLCERLQYLSFDDETKTWVKLGTPTRSIVPCAPKGTTRELNVESLQEPFIEKELPDQMVSVDCYTYAHMKSDALPVQMPDGMFCNIPQEVP